MLVRSEQSYSEFSHLQDEMYKTVTSLHKGGGSAGKSEFRR